MPPTLQEIADTIEEPSGASPIISKDKFEKLKRFIKEDHGLEWNDVKNWIYVGGFKHPDKENGKPCERSIRLETLFLDYYPQTGYKWLAHLKVMEARDYCYCETEIHWNYIIVKDLNVFKSVPNVYNKTPRKREYLIVGAHCVKHCLGIRSTKTCISCGEEHRNKVNECNNCRTDGKWEIYCCDYCKKRGQVKIPLNNEKRRQCNSCKEAWYRYCDYCKVNTETKCKINKKNGKRRCESCYQRHLEYALNKANERDYGYSHLSYQ